jgi:hypothetical protein
MQLVVVAAAVTVAVVVAAAVSVGLASARKTIMIVTTGVTLCVQMSNVMSVIAVHVTRHAKTQLVLHCIMLVQIWQQSSVAHVSVRQSNVVNKTVSVVIRIVRLDIHLYVIAQPQYVAMIRVIMCQIVVN